MTTTVQKSSIPSHGIDVSKNQFHNGIDFSEGIDSVKSMPGVLSSGCIDHGPIVSNNFKCFLVLTENCYFLRNFIIFNRRSLVLHESGRNWPILWPGPNTPTTFVSEDSKKWSLIINNDVCLPFCGLFIIYLYCLLTGCFCLLKRSDWTLRTSWARPRSQLKQCPLSTIQKYLLKVCK